MTFIGALLSDIFTYFFPKTFKASCILECSLQFALSKMKDQETNYQENSTMVRMAGKDRVTTGQAANQGSSRGSKNKGSSCLPWFFPSMSGEEKLCDPWQVREGCLRG